MVWIYSPHDLHPIHDRAIGLWHKDQSDIEWGYTGETARRVLRFDPSDNCIQRLHQSLQLRYARYHRCDYTGNPMGFQKKVRYLQNETGIKSLFQHAVKK